jgi:nicotinamidase-related amidase
MITAIDKQTALILIDLQKGILKNQTVHLLKNIFGKAALLINAFRAADLLIVTVNPIGAA